MWPGRLAVAAGRLSGGGSRAVGATRWRGGGGRGGAGTRVSTHSTVAVPGGGRPVTGRPATRESRIATDACRRLLSDSSRTERGLLLLRAQPGTAGGQE